MPKNSSFIIGGMGVGMSILTSLVEKARRRGLSDEDFHNLATPEGEPVLDQFAELMAKAKVVVQKVVSRVVASFAITCKGNLKTSDLVKAGEYDYANDWITDEHFPLQPHKPAIRRIELVELDYDPSSEQVLDELKRLGLKRPTAEDALEFGPEHPEEQRKRSIVFLHEPVLGPHSNRSVLVLHEVTGERSLCLYWFDDGWNRYYLFAGIRE